MNDTPHAPLPAGAGGAGAAVAAAAAEPVAPPPEAVKRTPRPRRRLKWGRLVFVVLSMAALAAALLEPERLGLPKDWPAQARDRVVALLPKPEPEKQPEAPKVAAAPAVSVFPAELGEVSERIVVMGTLVPRTEVMVAPEIEGQSVQEILADEGEWVEQGQVLARINRKTIEVQLVQNQAQLARANAAIAQAKTGITQAEVSMKERERSLSRVRTLKRQGFATNAQLDSVETAVQVSEAQVQSSLKSVDVAVADKDALMAAREELEWRLTRTEVRAPVAGTISRKNARVGQVASGAGEPMFRIIAAGDVEMEAEAADTAMPKLSVGQKVTVTLVGADTSMDGEIRLMRPAIDPATRLGKVRVKLPKDAKVILGASARGQIETGSGKGIVLPLSAIGFGKDRSTVQVVTDGVVNTRPVQLGVIGETTAEVVSGLAAGELVVAKAGTFLKDGDKVRPLKPGEQLSQPSKQAAADGVTPKEHGSE